jgi:cytochrome P450
MSIDDVVSDSDRKKNRYHFDRHTPEYRTQFEKITEEIHDKCPVAWTDTYDGHWVAGGSNAVFELARCPVVSNDHDINGERQGYQGISIPKAKRVSGVRGGILEMDEPEHRIYRTVLNPYLSPAAVKRWVPFIDEVTRACLDEKIEEGRIDFVDDLANIVPAVLTLAMLGIPLKNWAIYSEPVHASVYTPEHSPDIDKIVAMHRQMGLDLLNNMIEIKENPRPGIVNGLIQMRIDGEPAPDLEIMGNLGLVIGGGFDTTTALTAHSMEWLSQHPDQRERLSRERDTRRPVMDAPSPTTWNSKGRSLKRVSASGSPGQWPTATRQCSTSRTRSSWIVKATGTSALASVSTAASAPTWRERCSSRCSLRCSTGCRTTCATPKLPCTTRPSASFRACETCRPLSRRAAGSERVSTKPWRSSSGSATTRNWPCRSPSARKPQSSTETIHAGGT